jgi:uncharacterized 2Fe-2S/4Fe-4S cluster protein (DUF4445 family)
VKVKIEPNESLKQKVECLGGFIEYNCGGIKKCGKCKIKMLSSYVNPTEEELNLLSDSEIDENIRLACCHDVSKDERIIEVSEARVGMSILGAREYRAKTNSKQEGIGIVVDIGTTTIVIAYINLLNGEIFTEDSFENPQRKYGLDVVTRISYCNSNDRTLLVNDIRTAIKESIISSHHTLKDIKKMIVLGNTVMQYLFMDKDPRELGVVPFSFRNKNIETFSSNEIFRIAENFEILVIPSLSAYVGADVVSGIYFLELLEMNNCILLDLGTNGEMVLISNGILYSTSTAAGPAFEGGNMKCGVGGINGAIDHAVYKNDSWTFTTINNEKSCGICGSGYIEIIKEALENKIIDESGNLENEITVDKFEVSQDDIRNFQLAKSAISSGLEVLIETAGKKIDEIEQVFVAGGFGKYSSKESLIITGVIPTILEDKINVVGNSSLKGGIDMLFDANFKNIINKIQRVHRNIELGNNSDFSKKFIENIGFDYEKNN